MWNSVLIQRTLPLTISYLLLIIAAISFDCLLHIAHLAWIGRYLGFTGTAIWIKNLKMPCIVIHWAIAQSVTGQPNGNLRPSTMTGISGLTLITGQTALPAILNRGIIKNIPATTVMSIHSPVWTTSISRREYPIIKTAWNAIAMETRKKRMEVYERDKKAVMMIKPKNASYSGSLASNQFERIQNGKTGCRSYLFHTALVVCSYDFSMRRLC